MSALFSEIQIVERLFSSGTSLEIIQDHHPIGSIEKRPFCFQKIFDLKNQDNEILATLATPLISPLIFWGDEADITDGEGHPLGHLKRELLEISPKVTYHLFDADDLCIARAHVDIWHLSIEITSPTNRNEIYATLNLPYFHYFRHQWNLEIQQEIIDRRILFLLPVFHSSLHKD